MGAGSGEAGDLPDGLKLHWRTFDGPGLWGMGLTMLADAALYLSLIFGWFYLWTASPNWQPPASSPIGSWPLAAVSLAFGAGLWLLQRAVRRLRGGEAGGLAPQLWLAGGLGLLGCGGLGALLAGAGLAPTRNAHDAVLAFTLAFLLLHGALASVLAALQADLFFNYSHALERQAVAGCRRQAYAAIAAKLLENGETWTPMPRFAEVGRGAQVLPELLRSPQRLWGSRNWEAGLARGVFSQMGGDRRDALDGLFKQAGYAEVTQFEIYTLQARMKKLAVTTTISPEDRSRYYDVLSELDAKSAAMEGIAGQLIEQIEGVGMDLPEEFVSAALERLVLSNARGAKVYGECYVPIAFPLLDNRSSTVDGP